MFVDNNDVSGIKGRNYPKELLRIKNLIEPQCDEWESVKMIFEYEDFISEV